MIRSGRHAATGVLAIGLTAVLLLLPGPAGNRDNDGIEAFRGRVEAIRQPGPDADPGTPPVPIAEVRALEGSRAGQLLDAYLSGAGGSQIVADYRVGEEVVVTITAGPGGTEPFVSVSDRWRLPALQLIVAIFAVAVVAVGGWHGIRALIALGLTIAVILKVLLPLVIAGTPPVPLAVLSAVGITAATITLTEGWRRSSLAAILGTAGSLAIAALLGAAATALLGFTYTAGSDLAFLVTSGGEGLDLRGVLLAAFILGAVGVLDDVTVTQAVLVDELAATGLDRRTLLATAMRIGRSHIAATINTLFLAYVGGGLPVLVVLLVSRLPGALIANDEVLATEVVRTVVGSLGILAAVPLTTLIAAMLAPRSDAIEPRLDHRRVAPVAVVAAVIATLIAATALLPLTSGPRTALVPDVFEPGVPTPSAATASASADPGPATSASAGTPVLVGLDEPVPVQLGAEGGTITVVRTAVTPLSDDAAGRSRASMLVRYDATGAFDTARVEWSVLLVDGGLYPLVNDAGAPPEAPLAAGETLEATLSGEFPTSSGSAFIVAVDARTSDYLLAILIS